MCTRTTHTEVMLLIGDVDITMNNVDLKFEGNRMVINCDRDRTNVDARQWKNEVKQRCEVKSWPQKHGYCGQL